MDSSSLASHFGIEIAVLSSPIVANLVSSSKVCTYIQVKIQSFVANAWPDSKLPFKFLTLE